jgi:hypothetical protein
VTSRWCRHDVAIVIPLLSSLVTLVGPCRRPGQGGVVAMRPRARLRICAVHASTAARSYKKPPPRHPALPTLAASGIRSPFTLPRTGGREDGGGEGGVRWGSDADAAVEVGGHPWRPWTLRRLAPRCRASSASSTGAAYLLFSAPSVSSPPPSPSGHADHR